MFSDILLIAQNVRVTNWLSPVWIMSLGIAIGFLLAMMVMLKIKFCQRLPFFNSVAEKSGLFLIFGTLTSLFYLGLLLAFLYWLFGQKNLFSPDFNLALAFSAVGATLLGFGVWALTSRKLSGEFNDLAWGGFLKSINRVGLVAVLFSLIGLGLHYVNGFGLIKFFDQPVEFLHSLTRTPVLGVFEREFEVPPSKAESTGEPIEIAFDGSELKQLEVVTNRRLELSGYEISANLDAEQSVPIEANDADDPYIYYQRPNGTGIIPSEPITRLYVKNLGRDVANVKLKYLLQPVYSEAYVVPVIAATVLGLYFGYLVFSALCPKIAAIALSTYKTEVGQPLYWLILAITLTFIVLTVFIPYNTFGEDIKMYTDSGLTLIRVTAIFFAIWAASKSVAEEIEGRTALTVLSKPVGRRQFVIGKFAGIAMAVALMFVLVGLWFFIWVAFKPIYDFQEASKGLAEWFVCFKESMAVMPGLFLCFLEVLLFVAISVAISTRLGILSNFLICFSIYVVGHLTPLIVQSSLGAFEVVALFGKVIAVVFPVLNHFDVQTAINTGNVVPFTYLGWSVVYTLVYGTMVLLLALVLFEDRDLA